MTRWSMNAVLKDDRRWQLAQQGSLTLAAVPAAARQQHANSETDNAYNYLPSTSDHIGVAQPLHPRTRHRTSHRRIRQARRLQVPTSTRDEATTPEKAAMRTTDRHAAPGSSELAPCASEPLAPFMSRVARGSSASFVFSIRRPSGACREPVPATNTALLLAFLIGARCCCATESCSEPCSSQPSRQHL